ncbi:uncharacterized protein LOC122083855 [Macadamia integrifolia]|uniref:uncharacterized protein LOC122083855 n=1 Tax=Macadamia integrifolia TaxID=60698 RepID=UPI001C5019F5|nr:uncharacterized protein LOC122083855 [Macadamia integrifolia]
MKILRILVASVVAGATLVFLALSSTSTFPDVIFASHQDIGIVTPSRKLKDNYHNMHPENMKRNVGNVNLEDYRPLDPAPSSRSTIKAGPIEHGTPLNPYIPKPGPPSNPGFTESP